MRQPIIGLFFSRTCPNATLEGFADSIRTHNLEQIAVHWSDTPEGWFPFNFRPDALNTRLTNSPLRWLRVMASNQRCHGLVKRTLNISEQPHEPPGSKILRTESVFSTTDRCKASLPSANGSLAATVQGQRVTRPGSLMSGLTGGFLLVIYRKLNLVSVRLVRKELNKLHLYIKLKRRKFFYPNAIQYAKFDLYFK